MPDISAVCIARRQAKAILAHSALDLYPGDVTEADDEDLLILVEISGELETRLRERGCSGERGNELDRRIPLCAEAFNRSLEDGCRRIGGGALRASPKTLRVALMTSVASIDLSFGDSFSTCPGVFSTSTALPRWLFAGRVFVAFCLDVVGFGIFFELLRSLISAPLELGSRRSWSVVTVTGEHVDVEQTAARTESTVHCREVIYDKQYWRKTQYY